MALLQFQATDAKVAYLAVVYHLGRPGSEIDPETMGEHRASLAPLAEAIRGQLDQAVTSVEANSWQVLRLGRALQGASNELRQYGIAEGRSAVGGFSEALVELWPEAAEDPSIASDLVQHAVMLQRRLAAAVAEAEAEIAAEAAAAEAERQARRGRWWQVWRGLRPS
jgi:hypothetical protein